MIEEYFKTKTLGNIEPLENAITISGALGDITFGGKNMTHEQAQAKYGRYEEIDNAFWELNKETYYKNVSTEQGMEQ